MPRKIYHYLLVCFFISGLTSLVYEVLWTKSLTLLFGHTVFAVSTVLASFMAGLALGSYFFGKWIDQEIRAFRAFFFLRKSFAPFFKLYGTLEGAIGLYVLLTPLLFKGIERIYLSVVHLLPPEVASTPTFGSFWLLSLFRFFLSFLVLIFPTTCMGATLPVVGKFLVSSLEELGEKVGKIYALNTFGAVTGTFLAGFVLLPSVGLSATLVSCVVLNLGIAAIVWSVDREFVTQTEQRKTGQVTSVPSPLQADPPPPSPTDPAGIKADPAALWHQGLFLLIFSLTGFASMVYEVTWTRLLALALGSSVYAFTSMLTTFLFGIAGGSALYSKFFSGRQASPGLLGWTEVLLGGVALLIMPFFGELGYFFLRAFPLLRESFSLLLLGDFFLCFLVMILPTVLMGFAFPLAAQIFTSKLSSVGRSLGVLYSANTLGSIFGSALTGFLFLPLLGVQGSYKLGIFINLGIGLLFLLWKERERPQTPLFKLAGLFLAAFLGFSALIAPPWDRNVLAKGAAIRPDSYLGMSFDQFHKSHYRLLYYKDGLNTTVTVHQYGADRALSVSGKGEASTSPDADMPTQMLSGYLPGFYHPHPQTAAVVGLGSGVTIGSLAQIPEITRIDGVEIEPAVIEANNFFAKYNHYALKNPKVKMHVADGRNFILASKQKYDLIISEPSNPWMAGVATLFTQDFYRICRDKLGPGGIMCQWFQLYSMSPADVKMIVRTFYSVFPHGAIWLGAAPDLLMFGSMSEITFDFHRVTSLIQKVPAIKGDLEYIAIKDPDQIFAHFLLNLQSIREFSALGGLNTDDLNLLEYSAPRNLYLESGPSNIIGLLSYQKTLFPHAVNLSPKMEQSPDFFAGLAKQYEFLRVGERAEKMWRKAVSLDPKNSSYLVGLAGILSGTGRHLEAKELVDRAIGYAPKDASAHRMLAVLYESNGMPEPAFKELEIAYKLNPENLNTLFRLGQQYLRRKEFTNAERVLRKASEKDPSNWGVKLALARALSSLHKLGEAKELFRSISELYPLLNDPYVGLADIAIQEKDFPSAITLYRTALTHNPRNTKTHLELGNVYLTMGSVSEARRAFLDVLALEPFNSQAVQGLARTGLTR